MKNKPVPSDEPGLPGPPRPFLYGTAAVTGGAIMIIEILGAKMLAPFVGTSHFVWTAQIAVTLVALAVGYYLGGRFVDQTTRLSRIYFCILSSAIYLAVSVLCVRPIAYACLNFRLALGSLLASMALFFVPLGLLAMVGPFLIRVLTVSVASVGGNIGRLSAISTLGSFIGTVLIGYVLIPFLPNSITMDLTSLALCGVAVAYFIGWERRKSFRPVVAVAVATEVTLFVCGLVQEKHSGFSEVTELYRANSNFGLVQVVENKRGDRRFYLNDYLVQNIYDPKQKKSLALFTYALHDLAWAYTPQLKHVLCIGLGVGIVPNELAKEKVDVDVVEINPAVVPVASRLFDCDTSRLHMVIGDGRYFINECTNRYDSVIVDAFIGDSCPSHLMTRETFQSIRRILRANGTLVMNTFGEFVSGRDFFVSSVDKTLRSVFPSVRIHASGNGNVFFVASPRSNLEMIRQPDFEQVHTACRRDVMAAMDGLVHADPTHGIVLTDDYNPLEFYDAAMREEHRRALAEYMKTL